mgnify:CR=1 FL=1
MSDLLNNFTDDEVEKYNAAARIKQAGLDVKTLKNKKSVFNPETGTHDILTEMSSGGYVKIGEETIDATITRPGSILLNGREYGRETPEYQRYYPDPEPQPNVMSTSPSMGAMAQTEDAPFVSMQTRIEDAKAYASSLSNPTAQDLEAAGYTPDVINAVMGNTAQDNMPNRVVRTEPLSTEEVENIIRSGGSVIGKYDPTLRETGKRKLSQYLLGMAEQTFVDDLQAQGLTEDNIQRQLKAARPRLKNESSVLSDIFFGSPNSLGIGVGDFVTAGIMDIQEGARLFSQGRNNNSVADRGLGALLVLAGLAEATGVGKLISKPLKKVIQNTRAGLADVGERLNQPGQMPTVGSLGGNVEDEINKAIQLFDQAKIRREATTGRYVGGPPGLDTPQKLAALRKKVSALAEQGAPGRFWYERSGKAILDAVGGDKVEAEKIAQAIAITSSGTPVGANFDFALQAYLQNKAGQPISTGRFPQAMNKRLTDMFNGTPWEGRKTNSFYVNLMREIDPTLDQPVTVDIWMLRAFGYGTDNPTNQQYTFVENEVNKLADELGWEPQQVQAAIWVKSKADDEGISVDRAKFDYADALQKNKMQISWESIPGRTSGHMPEMFDAPYEVQQQYHVDISKAFLDDNGNDIVAQRLGIPSPGDFEAPGYFEGKVSPGTQTELAVPKQYKGPNYGAVEPAALELVNAYAAVRGILMKQDGVGFHRPFFNSSKKDANGVLLDIGRNFTERETARLGEILAELSGHTDYNPIAAPGGVRIINFAFLRKNPDGSKAMEDTWFSDDMLKTNKEFHKLVEEAVAKLDLDDNVGIDFGTFNAQEGYVGNDWSVNKNGEDYIKAASGQGSSDIQRKVQDLITELSPRIDAIDTEYQIRHGFTGNSEINAEFRSGITPPSEP